MVFIATFNNISGMSWGSVLLFYWWRNRKKPRSDLSQVTDKLYHI